MSKQQQRAALLRPGRVEESRGWRVPIELLVEIRAAAAEDFRSVNSEITYLAVLGLETREKEKARSQRIAS